MVERYLILVVEDEPDGQEVVSRTLSQANVQVQIAGDAEQALQLLHANGYSAVIIDLLLPGMDGFQLLQAIRNEPRLASIPCVAITAYHRLNVPKLPFRAIL